LEDNIIELIQVLALVHVGQSIMMQLLVLVLRRLDVDIIHEPEVHLHTALQLLYLVADMLLLLAGDGCYWQLLYLLIDQLLGLPT